jgi:hypothetical protein
MGLSTGLGLRNKVRLKPLAKEKPPVGLTRREAISLKQFSFIPLNALKVC